MADIHETLTYLSPIDWSEVPQDPSTLPGWLRDTFHAGELLCNSVPPPPNGTPFASSEPAETTSNAATSHKDMVASPARPYPPDKEHEELQKNWGKPMKYSQKDNPLNVAVYKMAGHDRHGAWFARRSVHEGLGFAKFKRAMLREFPESLAVQGGPGAGNVRGIGADRRLEQKEIDIEGRKASVEIYELSSSFPGPTTPRDFLTLCMASDDCLTDKSAAVVGGEGTRHVPRHWMLVSRPTKHPESPPRSGLIRGQYESVEMIREIPLHHHKNVVQSTPNLLSATEKHDEDKSRHRGATVSGGSEHEKKETDEGAGDAELNPVEWIMITRSDPAGGIPRFLVDRGTPGQMLVDVHKWLDWACKDEKEAPAESSTQQTDTLEKTTSDLTADTSAKLQTENGIVHRPKKSHTVAAGPEHQEQRGLFAGVAGALTAGLDAYAPASVSHYVHQHTDPQPVDDVSSDTSSDISSTASFMSAEESRRISSAPDGTHAASLLSQESLTSTISPPSSPDLKKEAGGKKLNHHEKEVIKLAKQRQKLEEKLKKKRELEETKLNEAREKETAEQTKAREKHEQQMKKAEERHAREVEKLEQKKEREARKAEEKRKKLNDRDILSRVTRERDEFRDQAELLRKENELLHNTIKDLQHENTVMVTRFGKMGPQGNDALRSVRDEISKGGGRGSRSSSVKSVDRKRRNSGDSARSGKPVSEKATSEKATSEKAASEKS